jgi:soluble lytic murein transglycosylase-like protein
MSVQTPTARRNRRADTAPSDNDKPRRKRKEAAMPSPADRRAERIRMLPGIVLVIAVLAVLLPNMLSVTLGATGRVITSIPNYIGNLGAGVRPAAIAPLFTEQVDFWAEDIRRWAQTYNVDPNLLATIMQIESCGHDTVSSVAGAQGLFQVMPFHFESGESMTDPDTNALRGANHLNDCLRWGNGDPGLALACYNGGPSVLRRDFSTWAAETQRYYTWGTAIYLDAQRNLSVSPTLTEWLNAGGQALCSRADVRLGL